MSNRCFPCQVAGRTFDLVLVVCLLVALVVGLKSHAIRSDTEISVAANADAVRPARDRETAGVSGKIVQPRDHEHVSSEIQVSGHVSHVVPAARYWVAVETGSAIFPKAEFHPRPDGRWEAVVFEGGTHADFDISIWSVPASTHGLIEDWLSRGRLTGSYPGLSSLPGAERIDIVEGLRLAR